MGESMSREREIEQAKKWRQTNWYDSVPPLLDEALAAYGQEKFEAGERLGRETERREIEQIIADVWNEENCRYCNTALKIRMQISEAEREPRA